MTQTKTITSSSGKTMRISTDERSCLSIMETSVVISILENAIAQWPDGPRKATAQSALERLRGQEV